MRAYDVRCSIGLLLLGLGCAGGSDLVSTSFDDETGTQGLVTVTPTSEGSGSATVDTSAGTLGETTDGGTPSESSDASADSSTGDDCLNEEICDGLDNDCDDEVDEGCDCSAGDTQTCYSGPKGTEGVGLCNAGGQVCGSAGTWGACDGEVTPADEVCNGEDDDCDDAIDEELDEQATCGEGICQVTVDLCLDGVPSKCEPGDPDPEESCNGLDDDCDGDVDETCTCMDGEVQSCYGGPMGTQGVGICHAGSQTCVDGTFGDCVGAQTPVAESCDGFDNDCDLATDENNPGGGGACNTGLVGVCQAGTQQCSAGALSCVQNIAVSAETCDGLDNDCDTGVDEGNPGGGGACNTGMPGACGPGTSQCQGGALSCVQNVAASAEVCDATDNDCDGTNNEGNPGAGQGCVTGLAGVCGPGTTACVGTTLVCNQNVGASGEVCDGLDNDCDTGTDEGNPGGGGACFTGQSGPCSIGVNNCTGGAVGCTQTVFPSADTCFDGVDQDCNGTVDDGCCAHNECTSGVALLNGCTPCVSAVCAADPFCCSDAWDDLCVFEVMTECGTTQCSTCSHGVCTQGAALVAGCDAGFGCVQSVCTNDPFCCSSGWDAQCVAEIATYCPDPIAC